MGRWNRRYWPRSNRRNNYQDYRWSPPRQTYRDPEFGIWQDNVPLWEKKFCFLVGVPWEKVLSTKKYMHCHSNVLDWDDAAGKEAFYSAKERFWAKFNGGQCEVHPQGPDVYIDEVDWNSYIDPELVKDLDRAFFVPDDKERETKVNSGGGSEVLDGRLDNMGNSWDCDRAQTSRALKDKATGWNHWDDSVDARENPTNNGNPWDRDRWNSSIIKHDDNDNPWEHDRVQTSRALKDKATGWNRRDDRFDATEKQPNNGNPWECHNRSVSATVKHDSWGNAWSKKCDWKPESYLDKVKSSGDNGNKWRNGKIWQEFGESSRGHNHWEPHMSGSSYRNSSNYHAKKQFGQYGRPRRVSAERREGLVGICRKREGSNQYDQTSRRWDNGSSNKRVSFTVQ